MLVALPTRRHVLTGELPLQLVYVRCFIFVSVIMVILLGSVVSPTLNPHNLEGQCIFSQSSFP